MEWVEKNRAQHKTENAQLKTDLILQGEEQHAQFLLLQKHKSFTTEKVQGRKKVPSSGSISNTSLRVPHVIDKKNKKNNTHSGHTFSPDA